MEEKKGVSEEENRNRAEVLTNPVFGRQTAQRRDQMLSDIQSSILQLHHSRYVVARLHRKYHRYHSPKA